MLTKEASMFHLPVCKTAFMSDCTFRTSFSNYDAKNMKRKKICNRNAPCITHQTNVTSIKLNSVKVSIKMMKK